MVSVIGAFLCRVASHVCLTRIFCLSGPTTGCCVHFLLDVITRVPLLMPTFIKVFALHSEVVVLLCLIFTCLLVGKQILQHTNAATVTARPTATRIAATRIATTRPAITTWCS